MVGVPRSKGCRVCVTRRVKCDLTRPFCNRCVKAQRECPGYEPSIKFQDEGPKLRELYRHETSEQVSATASTHGSSEDPQFEYTTEAPLTLRLTQGAKEGSEEAGEDELRPKSTFETRFLVAIMSPDVHQAQLISAFITSITPNQSPALQPTFRYTKMFLSEVAGLAADSHVLEWAVRAVSISHLGRQVEDQHLVQMSRQMYRQALLTLNAALQDPIDGLSSTTLAATILLSFYEVINCTEKDSWVRHAGGAGHLMRLRGPTRHRTGLGRSCFLAYRHSLVIEAFLSRTATFLAQKPWLDLSREIQKGLPERTPISDLIDDFHLLIVEYPGFLQSAHDVTTTAAAGGTAAMRKKLLTMGHAHRGNMKIFHKRLLATLDETDQPIGERASQPHDLIFPTVYRFPSLAVGSLFCGHRAIATVLNRTCALLESSSSGAAQQHPSDPAVAAVTTAATASPGFPAPAPASDAAATRTTASRYHLRNTPSDGGKYTEENLRFARDSCKAAEALSCSAFLGPLYLIFALRVAYFTFESGPEKEWVLEKLEEVSAHLGIARVVVGGGVQGEQAQEPGGRESGDPSRRKRDGRSSFSASASASASQSPELSRQTSGQEEVTRQIRAQEAEAAVRRGSWQQEQAQQQQQQEDLSRRTSVSLQEIERRPSGQSERSGEGRDKGKGALR